DACFVSLLSGLRVEAIQDAGFRQRIDCSLIRDGRRQIRATARLRPNNIVVRSLAFLESNVTAGAGTKCEQRATAATIDIKQTFISERRRNRRQRHSLDAPQLFSRQVITDHRLWPNCDNLGSRGIAPNVWRGPARTLVGRVFAAEIAFRAPDPLACLFVEGGDVLLFLVVAHDDEQVTSECRRAAAAELKVNRVLLELGVPNLVAFQVKRP